MESYQDVKGKMVQLTIPNTSEAKEVAQHHAFLIIENGQANIQPIEKNKVFVNKFEIKRKKIGPDHQIRLGQDYTFNLNYFFKFKQGKIIAERKSFDFTVEFQRLQSVWDDYLKQEKAFKNKETLFSGLTKIPYLIGPILSILFAKTQEEKARKNRLELQSKSPCVCPMCQSSLLDKTWEEWKTERGHYCGANW